MMYPKNKVDWKFWLFLLALMAGLTWLSAELLVAQGVQY